jgi:hypothetical protein
MRPMRLLPLDTSRRTGRSPYARTSTARCSRSMSFETSNFFRSTTGTSSGGSADTTSCKHVHKSLVCSFAECTAAEWEGVCANDRAGRRGTLTAICELLIITMFDTSGVPEVEGHCSVTSPEFLSYAHTTPRCTCKRHGFDI